MTPDPTSDTTPDIPLTPEEAAWLADAPYRARHLFDDGCRAEILDDAVVEITTRDDQTYEIDTAARTCTCPDFARSGGAGSSGSSGPYVCEHLLGWQELLERQERHRDRAQCRQDMHDLEDHRP